MLPSPSALVVLVVVLAVVLPAAVVDSVPLVVAVASAALPVAVVASVVLVVVLPVAVVASVVAAVLPVVVVASVVADIRSDDPMYCLLTAFGGYGSFVQEYLFRLLVHPVQLQLNWLQAVEYHQSKKNLSVQLFKCFILFSIDSDAVFTYHTPIQCEWIHVHRPAAPVMWLVCGAATALPPLGAVWKMTLTARRCLCQHSKQDCRPFLTLLTPQCCCLDILLCQVASLYYILTTLDLGLSMSRRTSAMASSDSSSGVPPSGDGGVFEISRAS